MATVTPAATFPVGAPFNTSPAYSGTFIPQLWSKKLNAKFYAHTLMTEIANTDWEGEIKAQGDSIRIHTAPTITINDYKVGDNLQYEVATPDYIDMQIDQGKSFSFQLSDVLKYQSNMGMMDMFSTDAAKQMRIKIEAEAFYAWFVTQLPATGPAIYNRGANAGVLSQAYNLGTDQIPIDQTAPENVLNAILGMASALDEQNVPDDGRWLLITPRDRQLLMASSLRQAYLTGDDKSTIRSGKIGMIDRFSVYVSNLLPTGANGYDFAPAGASPNSVATISGAKARRMMVAGTKAACAFASQMMNTETLRNPSDFGDLVRGLNIYGRKLVKPTALAIAQVGSLT